MRCYAAKKQQLWGRAWGTQVRFVIRVVRWTSYYNVQMEIYITVRWTYTLQYYIIYIYIIHTSGGDILLNYVKRYIQYSYVLSSKGKMIVCSASKIGQEEY